MKMNVYELSYNSADGYGRGMAIVAANTPEEAITVANEHERRNIWHEPFLIGSLTYSGTEPRIVASEYYQE